jgi:hypothetical protein
MKLSKAEEQELHPKRYRKDENNLVILWMDLKGKRGGMTN